MAAQRSIDLICEEISPGVLTIAGELAQSLCIRWEPVDMGEQEKRGLGIPKKWGRNPMYLGDAACTKLTEEGYQRDLGNGWVEIELRHPGDTTRDEFMFDRVMDVAGDAKSVMLLCGYNHVLQLERKLRQAGHEVVWDALFSYKWFGP
jgi:hypothetical protein